MVARKYPTMYPIWSSPDMSPLAAGGQSSRAVATAFPYMPPIAIPNSARQARNWSYVWQKPVPSSSTIKRMLLTTNGHLRPYLSAARPKPIAPIERSISTSVRPHVMSLMLLSNSAASCVVVKLTVKKSCHSVSLLLYIRDGLLTKASQVHAAMATCVVVSSMPPCLSEHAYREEVPVLSV
jgi:hypothetical protein